MQRLVYGELLPVVLGSKLTSHYDLDLFSGGDHYKGYDHKVNPNPDVAFFSSALRYGHSMIFRHVNERSLNHTDLVSTANPIRNHILQPFILYDRGATIRLALGMIDDISEPEDSVMIDDTLNHMTQLPGAPVGDDLAATNILRGREIGIPGYMAYRRYCHLPTADTFDGLGAFMPESVVSAYRNLYGSVEDIDLFSAGISEHHADGGAMVGPTFGCLLGEAFRNARQGDHYWYENHDTAHKFTSDQLRELRKITWSRLICDFVTGGEKSTVAPGDVSVQKQTMLVPDPETNPRYKCSDFANIPQMNLKPWKE